MSTTPASPASALAAWLQAQEAPELIPGVPGSVADKVLYISLLDPALFGGQPTPSAVASAQWAADGPGRGAPDGERPDGADRLRPGRR